jgi:hypothetical protein
MGATKKNHFCAQGTRAKMAQVRYIRDAASIHRELFTVAIVVGFASALQRNGILRYGLALLGLGFRLSRLNCLGGITGVTTGHGIDHMKHNIGDFAASFSETGESQRTLVPPTCSIRRARHLPLRDRHELLVVAVVVHVAGTSQGDLILRDFATLWSWSLWRRCRLRRRCLRDLMGLRGMNTIDWVDHNLVSWEILSAESETS